MMAAQSSVPVDAGQACIRILLATFNGAPWLAGQLDSLLAQTDRNWCVLAHDDGSTDDTRQILLDYAARWPQHFRLLDDGVRCGGARANFEHLMRHAGGHYVMFCDQDDIWDADKIALTRRRMSEVEAAHPGLPVLVHTDLRVVDSQRRLLSPSLQQYQRLQREIPGLARRLVQNNVTGCTVMLNPAALALSWPMPAGAAMHDWWAACRVVQAGGLVSRIGQATMDYRQHAGNSLGAQKASSWTPWLPAGLHFRYQQFMIAWRQARALVPGISPLQLLRIKLHCVWLRWRGLAD